MDTISKDGEGFGTISVEDFNRVIGALPTMPESGKIPWRVTPKLVPVFEVANEHRAELGLKPLSWDDFFDRFANGHNLFA